MTKKFGSGTQRKGNNMTDINKLSDYERGEWDCVHGHQARDCDSDEYYRGYGETYAKEANATWYSEQIFEPFITKTLGAKYE